MLLNEYNELRIQDFGLSAKIVDMIHSEFDENEQSSKKGTPTYMSPELFSNQGVMSFQSDFWAMGVILYEMAVGKPPFESNSFTTLVDLILNSHFEPIKDVSIEFNDLIS